jgi:hypothetical protein
MPHMPHQGKILQSNDLEDFTTDEEAQKPTDLFHSATAALSHIDEKPARPGSSVRRSPPLRQQPHTGEQRHRRQRHEQPRRRRAG